MYLCKYDLSKECKESQRDCVECVIEDIKTEIETEYKEHKVSNCRYGFGLLYALKIIDKHISGGGDK